METCYKFRIYPNNKQHVLMQKTFGCCRYLYNHFLAEQIEAYKSESKSVSRFEQDKKLPVMKQEFEWLREVDSTALQAVAQNLESAYQNFFRRVKNNENPGFPRFKRKHDNRKSYKSKAVGKTIEVLEKEIKLPKMGKVECRVSKLEEYVPHKLQKRLAKFPRRLYRKTKRGLKRRGTTYSKRNQSVRTIVGRKNTLGHREIYAWGVCVRPSQDGNGQRTKNPPPLGTGSVNV